MAHLSTLVVTLPLAMALAAGCSPSNGGGGEHTFDAGGRIGASLLAKHRAA